MLPVVAIDGPAGSGKSTLARRLALELGLPYVNTGSMYRALAARAAERGIGPDDVAALAPLARALRFDLDESVDPPELTIDGRPAGADLQSAEVESTVSRVARHPQVREILRAEQRRLIEGGAVVEGRDIGSVVAPHAEVKLYLHADERERVDRRVAERDGQETPVADALGRRDAADARTTPFVPADDAVEIDTTHMEPDEVAAAALAIVRARLAELEW
jgi:cytidylate kinase